MDDKNLCVHMHQTKVASALKELNTYLNVNNDGIMNGSRIVYPVVKDHFNSDISFS